MKLRLPRPLEGTLSEGDSRVGSLHKRARSQSKNACAKLTQPASCSQCTLTSRLDTRHAAQEPASVQRPGTRHPAGARNRRGRPRGFVASSRWARNATGAGSAPARPGCFQLSEARDRADHASGRRINLSGTAGHAAHIAHRQRHVARRRFGAVSISPGSSGHWHRACDAHCGPAF